MTETAIATIDAELVADNALVPAGSRQFAFDSIRTLSNPTSGVATSIDLNPANAVRLYKVNSDAEPLEENIGTVINLRHYVATVVDFQAETRPGHFETRTGVRLVLVDDVEGKSYATMSEVVMSDLKPCGASFHVGGADQGGCCEGEGQGCQVVPDPKDRRLTPRRRGTGRAPTREGWGPVPS